VYFYVAQAIGSLPAPTNLRSKVLSPTTIWLQWSDASLGRQQTVTDNRYYNVYYQSTNNGNDRTVVVKELHVVLYNLLPATTYEFKVGLVKDGLTSAFSDVVINRTMETGMRGTNQLGSRSVSKNVRLYSCIRYNYLHMHACIMCKCM